MSFQVGTKPTKEQLLVIFLIEGACESLFRAFDRIADKEDVTAADMVGLIDHSVGSDLADAYAEYLYETAD